ncbi:MAG TPA: hypothetical protein VI911_10090 [Patescibacteria group bacterium]|nr:hypothetical protein [Patescibacteria group bacterium]
MANNDKVKFSITSDGTSEGTKIVLNGENIVDSKKIVACQFSARAAAMYPDYDGRMQQNPEDISFSYMSIDKNDKGEKVYVRYEFNLAKDKWEPTITPIGEPTPQGDGGVVEDNLIGNDSTVVKAIINMASKVKRYIPERKDLINRTYTSLSDMLKDIQKEM